LSITCRRFGDLTVAGFTGAGSTCADFCPFTPEGSLKKELIHQERYATRDEARQRIFEYIEVFYNRERRHSALGYQSPCRFEGLAA
jgi:transposase InsO family protein